MKLSYEIADYLTSQGKRCIIRKEALEGQMAHSQLVTEEVEGIWCWAEMAHFLERPES